MGRLIITLLFVFVFAQLAFAVPVQVSGFVRDKQTGESLIGVNILLKESKYGTTTDNRGYFSIQVVTPCVLEFSFVGYQQTEQYIGAISDTVMVVYLDFSLQIDEVTVYAPEHISRLNTTRITSKQLERLPSITGKPDVMKTLQTLPGVLNHSEGLSLMMVRGGEPGQNQYLLDNVPLIYVSHLGGFMSVFNPDMVNAIDFYKGNFPASHGGKLSSIVDVTQRDGDVSEHKGAYSIGITDASFVFEGPLAEDKMSYIITARKTFIDAFLSAATLVNERKDHVMFYGFHDINAKINWKPDNKNNLSLNFYQGDDYLPYWNKPWMSNNGEKTRASQIWGNFLLSSSWSRVVNAKLFTENIVSFSRYRNTLDQYFSSKEDSVISKVRTKNRSSVNDYSLRTDWKYALLKNWRLHFGSQLSYQRYEPAYIAGSLISKNINDISNPVQVAFYLDNRIDILNRVHIQPSVRYSLYVCEGDYFAGYEPRLSIHYKASPTQHLHLNYMEVSQYSHLVFVRSFMLKKEIWLPATKSIPPQSSRQISGGWNGGFFGGGYSAETSFYLKQMKNLTVLKEGYENLYGIISVEEKLEIGGLGFAYGAEFCLKKNFGKWQGTASYAWSNATRQFSNINNGLPFEYDFNRKHSIHFDVSCKLSKFWSLQTAWVFQSGLPYSPALGKQYTFNPDTDDYAYIGIIYGEKNSAKMQPYHRLDIGFTRTTTNNRGNKTVWSYSLYNAYNRINPYDYYYDNDSDRQNTTIQSLPLKLYKIGLFSIIPSVSYKVYFNYSQRDRHMKVENRKADTKPVHKKKWLYFE